MKTKIITWLVTIAAFIDIIYSVLIENSSVLTEIGISPEVSKYIFLGGVLWNAFNEKIGKKKQEQISK